jgi:adenylate cyclase
MSSAPSSFDPERLEQLGVYDPAAPDAVDRLELIRDVMALGASVEDIAAAVDLGDLALELSLRTPGPSTLGQVVGDLGLDLGRTQRLMTALGLATDTDRILTVDEAEAIGLLAVAGIELLGEEATMQLARVAGTSMARVAETLVSGFRLQVQLPRLDTGTSPAEFVREYSALTDSLLPVFVRSLGAVLRNQMVEVTKRVWSTDDERSAVTLPRTVGFVDLVGYTEAAAASSVRQLTAVLIDFDERTAEAVSRAHGQIIKTIGDEAMFVTEDAGDACRIALDLVGAFGHGTVPPVRVGLATGEMISVFGDLYGPDVNLAARLVSVAHPSTVLVSERTRESADGFTFADTPPQVLKGIAHPVTAFRLR